jgi:hypothetical protein
MAWRGTHFNRALLVMLLLGGVGVARGQSCPGARRGRLAIIAGGYAGAEALGLGLEHNHWWTTPATSFHVVWDASASDGQDRLLHAAVAYQTSQLGAAAFTWACLKPVAAAWLGAALGVAVAIPKEIGDGLHAEKGFSAPDMAWTALGAVLPAARRTWAPVRLLSLKVSYWPSDEYRQRTGTQPRLESDYAGQRYFLALAPSELRPGGRWPRWLGLAVGHSVPYWASQPPVHGWYGALDLRLSGLPIRAGWWRRVAWVLDQIHLPAPGVRLRQGDWAAGFF